MTLDVDALRAQFPALGSPSLSGEPPVFFDNPAATQVPQMVIDSYARYYTMMNANAGGYFQTSRFNDMMTANVRQQFAEFFNASLPAEIVFGQNMTTLNMALSRALAATLKAGDEIVLTRMDHDANVSPWLLIAADNDLTVRWVDILTEDATLDMDSLEAALNDRTKIVATVHASNAVGTINPVTQIAQMAHAADAYYVVDAVQSAPHIPLDVEAIGADFVLVSAYKFFGPHLGVMWGRYDLLESLPVYKVRPSKDMPPNRWETGTNIFEGINAAGAALAYIQGIGQNYGGEYANLFESLADDRRLDYKYGMEAIRRYEVTLVMHLIDVLQDMPGVTIYGITDPTRTDDRCPTVAFAHERYTPDQIAKHLGEHSIHVWAGHYYAIEIMNRLGHAENGLLRVGLAHYNTVAEIDRFAEVLRAFLKG